METFADSPLFFFVERPEFPVARADGKIVELSDAACDARESLTEFLRGRSSPAAAAAAAPRSRWNYYYHPRKVTNECPTTECRQCGEKREIHLHPSRNPNYQRAYESEADRIARARLNQRRIPRDWNWYNSRTNQNQHRQPNSYQQIDDRIDYEALRYQNFARWCDLEGEQQPRDPRKRRSKWNRRDANSREFDSQELTNDFDFQFYEEDLGSRTRQVEDLESRIRQEDDLGCRIRQEEDLESRMRQEEDLKSRTRLVEDLESRIRQEEEDLESRMRQDSGAMLATDQESLYEVPSDRRIANRRQRRFIDRGVDRDSLSNVSVTSVCSTIERKSRSFTKVPVDRQSECKNGFWEFVPLNENSDRRVVEKGGATDPRDPRNSCKESDKDRGKSKGKKFEVSTQANRNKVGETVERELNERPERSRIPKRPGSGQILNDGTKKPKVTGCDSSLDENRSKGLFERTSACLKRKFASEKSRSEELSQERPAKGKRNSRLPVRIGPRLRSRNPSVRRNPETKMAPDLPEAKEQSSVRSRTKPRIRPSILQTNRVAQV